jgi:SAM-dependent methyltransferase
LDELCRIRRAIGSQKNAAKKQFMEACFSAILPACTARRGKQHGWFADNTPLPRGVEVPPYQNAIEEFVARINRNLTSAEELYAYLERDGRSPGEVLQNARVVQVDAANARAVDYGVEEGTVAGVITSPPYLCMADYTLGQRLSYYWLRPECLEDDFAKEIGARRLRARSGNALEAYLQSMGAFVQNMSRLLRPGGFLCTVLGAPTAKAFEEAEIVEAYDRLLADAGFDPIWDRERSIHWHRNYGYARLKKERISVHVLRDAVAGP